jgi:two-component system sensor histidine kinase SenX3
MNRSLVFLLVVLAAILGVLATLQYRWIDRVSVAERQQMRENIEFAGRVFADDLKRELEPIAATFDREGDVPIETSELIETIYDIAPAEGDWLLSDATGVVEWPPELAPLRQRLRSEVTLDLGRGPPHFPPPFLPEVPALFLVERRGPRFGGPPDFPRIVLVKLDRAALRDGMLPRLAQRHFASGYDVAIVSGDTTIFRWGRAVNEASALRNPDVDIPLAPIAQRRPEGGGPPPFRMRERPRRQEPGPEPGQWHLLVRRHHGGVDAAVASARRRNLAVSFGTVLILGAAVLLLVALLRRAERLRQQQIEFVAAISHELNTPVAALRSAGENLRDGIIAEPEKVTRYGESIVRESTRLGELVGQVLELAGMQSRRARPHEAVDVASVIDEAVAQTRWLIADSTIAIETKVEEDLPPINGDRNALTRAVQNLVANAVRHGGSGEWIGVQATRDGDQVRITVEDRGPGIDASEASHLFDPFYRGSKSASVPGAGLGLAIVRQIALAHGGSVNVERRRTGAAFTINLPAPSSKVPSPRNGGERARVRGGSSDAHV